MSVPVEDAWDFFSQPKNLHLLTPPSLNLRFIAAPFGGDMYPGQIITYRVKPFLGIPIFWMTEITQVQKPHFFVDEQRRGPYALWHHQHHFKSFEGGTEMTDLVHYQLPFGPLGALGTSLVKKQLVEIFTYRRQRIEELFGDKN